MSHRRRRRWLRLQLLVRRARDSIVGSFLQLWDKVALWWLVFLYGAAMLSLFLFIALRLMSLDARKDIDAQMEELRLVPKDCPAKAEPKQR